MDFFKKKQPEILPQSGKCFSMNGEIFACGELLSPVSAEKGKIFTTVPPPTNASPSPSFSRKMEIPEISLFASLSDECMSPHSYKALNAAESWDMSVLDQIEKQGRPRRNSTRSKRFSKSAQKKPANGSFWNWFFNSGSCEPLSCAINDLSWGSSLSTCPHCSRILLNQQNAETRQNFPPFCATCQTYFVSEAGAENNELDALVTALSSDDPNEASADRPSKGKIVVVKEKTMLSCPTLCGTTTQIINLTSPIGCTFTGMMSPKLSTDNSKGSRATRNGERRDHSSATSVTEMTFDNTLGDDDTHLNKSIHVGLDDSELIFSFSGFEESILTEEMSIYNDIHQVQEVAEMAILKKAGQSHSLIAKECARCSMALMENNGKVICVTCPKIRSMAKQQAQSKRLEGRERLIKLEFIPSELESPVLKNYARQESFQNKSVGYMVDGASLSKEHQDHEDLIELQGSCNLSKQTGTKDTKETGLMEVTGNPISYAEYNHQKPETIVVHERDHPSSKQPVFILSEDSFESGPRLDILHGNVIDEDMSTGSSEHKVEHCNRNIYEEGEMKRINHSSNEMDSLGTTDPDRDNRVKEKKERNPPRTSSISERERVGRVDLDRSTYEAATKECSFWMGKPSQLDEGNKIERKTSFRSNPTIETSQGDIQDQVKERYERQMKAYLDISTSFEKSIVMSYSSKDDDSLSVERTNSKESAKEKRVDSVNNEVDVKANKVPDPEIISEKYVNETVSAPLGFTQEANDRFLGEGIDISQETAEIVPLPSIRKDDESGGLVGRFEKGGGAIEVQKGASLNDGDGEIRTTLPRVPEPHNIQCAATKTNGYISHDERVLRKGEVPADNPRDIPSNLVENLSPSMLSSSLPERNSFDCSKYDTRPLLSMSYSLPSVDHRGCNQHSVNSNDQSLVESVDDKNGRMDGPSKEGTSLNYSAFKKTKAKEEVREKVSQPLKDMTNGEHVSQKIDEQQRLVGPRPEQLHHRKFIKNPQKLPRSPWRSNNGQLCTIKENDNSSFLRADAQKRSSNAARNEYIMTLLRQLDSVAARISALDNHMVAMAVQGCDQMPSYHHRTMRISTSQRTVPISSIGEPRIVYPSQEPNSENEELNVLLGRLRNVAGAIRSMEESKAK